MIVKLVDSWLREYLNTEATPQDIAQYLTLCGPTVESVEQRADDVVYTIELTPNRNDLSSVIGLAREAAAILPLFGKKTEFNNLPSYQKLPAGSKQNQLIIKLDKDLVTASISAVVNLKLGPSPTFIKTRLEKAGIRSLNNVIDISNYVMLETGQPLHIFDYDKIEGHRMTVRASRKGEKLETLDGVLRSLPTGSIVIEDQAKLIDLCGIMGAENSSVDQHTSKGLIWIELYQANKIQKTFRALNLVTEAALRYEKYLDPHNLITAFGRTLELLEKHADAKLSSPIFQQGKTEVQSPTVSVDLSLIQEYLNQRISVQDSAALLRALGFQVEVADSQYAPPVITVTVPSWRVGDIERSEDLIEEIARLYGYHKLIPTLPSGEPPAELVSKQFEVEAKMEDSLVADGFHQTYSYSFTAAETMQKTKLDTQQAVEVLNPLNANFVYLRTSLLGHLLKALATNQHQATTLKLFELERVFFANANELPKEVYRLAGVVWGYKEHGFFHAKKALENICCALNITDVQFTRPDKCQPYWTPQQTAEIRTPQHLLGTMGVINQEVKDNWNITGELVGFELDSDLLVAEAQQTKKIKQLIEHPPINEDLSVLVSLHTDIAEITQIIANQLNHHKGLELSTCQLKDIYTGQALPPETKSLTFSLSYQAADQTPMQTTVTQGREALIKVLQQQGFQVRS